MLACKRTIPMVMVLLLAILSFFSVKGEAIQAAQFSCPQDYLRVALGTNLTSAEFAVKEGSYELVDYVTQRVISSNPGHGTWIVAPKGSQNIQISCNGQPVEGLVSSLCILRQKDPGQLNLFSYKNKRYRGDLLIENLNGRLFVINVIGIEHYLYGVVGAEMGMGASLEAYKAQAVVSRTYAMYHKQHPQLNYDLGINQQWQVYGGYESEVTGGAEVKKAVDETAGLVIFYDNSLIQAFFHSNSGGYTEGSENVWYINLPYLRPVATPEDAFAAQVAQNGDWPGVSYQWQISFTRQELMTRLNQWNKENPDNAVNVGEILDLVARRQAVDPATREYLPVQTQSGRVTQFDFIGTKGTKSFFRDNIRSVLGLRSTLFELYLDSTVRLWNAFNTVDVLNQTAHLLGINADGLISGLNGKNDKYYVLGADGVKELPKNFTTITIKGKGYGHGLGMSQWGAIGMAAKGIDYKNIIEHFYNQGKHDGRLVIKPYYSVQKI